MEYGGSQQLAELFWVNHGGTLGAEIARRALREWRAASLKRLPRYGYVRTAQALFTIFIAAILL